MNINDKAIKRLQDLALLQLIRMRKEKTQPIAVNWAERYKGAMSKQPLADIDTQLNELPARAEAPPRVSYFSGFAALNALIFNKIKQTPACSRRVCFSKGIRVRLIRVDRTFQVSVLHERS
ncbi:MAG: hypothetical protein SH848_05615 [Saprospiraceae bacterium]|nr:hypothetical protein [Saprospiraceae bacterium]MDZ4703384.1 hypothetical protein [Saprospiraceae bacterium]